MVTERPPSKRGFFLLLFVALVGFCAGVFLRDPVGLCVGIFSRASIPFQSVDLSIDMEVDKGTCVEVYINGEASPPFRLSLNPGRRDVYRIHDMPAIISRMRIDPTDVPQADIKIYSLVFSRGEKAVRQLAVADLQEWRLINTRFIEANEDFLHLESETDDPIITQDVDYILSKSFEGFFNVFRKFLSGTKAAKIATEWSSMSTPVLLFGLLILVIADFKNPYRFAGGPFLILLLFPILFGKGIVDLFLSRVGRAPPIQYAVGYASYSGYSKSLEMLSFHAVTLTAVLIAVTLFFIYRKREKGADSIACNIDKQPATKPASWVFLLVLLGLFAVFGFPQLSQAFANLDHANHGVHFDGLSMLTWQYEMHMGWLPFRDFWYPYGAFAYIDGPFPWEMASFFLHNFVIFASFLIAVYCLVDRNKLWTLILLSITLLLIVVRYISDPYRYFVSLDYVLLFLVLQREKKAHRFYYALYGVFSGLFFIFDPIYCIYASCPVFVLLIIHLVRTKDRIQRSVYLRKVAWSAAVFGGFLLADVVLLWKQGQLGGFLYFYRHLNTLATSCAIPAALKSWFRWGMTPNHFLVYLIPLFIAYGVYLSLAKKDAPDSECANILLSTGLLSLVLFQKNLIRMHMAPQIIGICIVGGLLCLYRWSRYWNRFQKCTAVFTLLFLLGFEQVDWRPKVQRYFEGVPYLFSNVNVLARDHDEIEQKIDSYFSIERFQNIPGATEFARYYNESMQTEAGPKVTFYVLGDASFLYIIAKQKPPYHITLYNGCNIYDQKVITDWLEENRVEFVVWDPAFTDFDRVPNLVRIPNIFD